MTTTTTSVSETSDPRFPFFILLSLQYRLKQVSLSKQTHSETVICDCYQTNQTNQARTYQTLLPFSTLFQILDTESYLAAAMQNPTLSPSDAGVYTSSNLPIGNNLHTYINTCSKATTDPEIIFPSTIFPQLNSLKRELQHRHFNPHLTKMEPLNWAQGRRANRPFENVNSEWLAILNAISPTRYPVPPPRPAVIRERERDGGPTAYYVEQAAFYNQEPGPDPFPEPLTENRSGPLKRLVYGLLSLFLWFLEPLLIGVKNLGLSVWAGMIWLVLVVFVWPVIFMGRMLKTVRLRWDFVLGVVLAWQLVRMLPWFGLRLPDIGAAVVKDEVAVGGGPVYTIFVPGREAIGSGAVIQSMGV